MNGILAKLNIKPGAPVTQDTLEEAKKLWMELYLFFMILRTTNPLKSQQIKDMRMKLAEVNELIQELEIS